jgi:glutaconate CoA-transferase, subunit B
MATRKLSTAQEVSAPQKAEGTKKGASAQENRTGQNERYSLIELMICAAAHLLKDNKTAVIGTGAPLAAAMLAQKTHAPNLIVMFEAGGIAPILEILPISVGGSATQTHAIIHGSMHDIMEACQRGAVDYAFLSGAQIDRYGNLNSTMIGDDYAHPKVRLPGSGGANDLASLCWQTVTIIPHEIRKFVPKLDFITTPGYLTGAGAREAAGLPRGSGPYKVISTLAVMGFDPVTRCMQVERIHPGVTREDVIANTGFEMLFADPVQTTPEPTDLELHLLREEVDPLGRVIGKKPNRESAAAGAD